MTMPTLIGEGRVEYSTIRSNNSRYALLQQLNGSINLHELDGKFIRTLPSSLRTDTAVVLSRSSNYHVYYLDGNSIYIHHLIDNSNSLVARFNQYSRLSTSHVESDLTPSGWLALVGILPEGMESIFAYNLTSSTTTEHHVQSESFDGLKVDDSGTLIISKSSGIYTLPRYGTSRRLTTANGHACVTNQGLSWCSSADASINSNSIYLIDISTGVKRKLKSYDWSYALHITSDRNSLYVSTYDPNGLLPYQVWDIPFNPMIMPTLLHEWRGPYRGYDSQPKVTYSEGRLLYNVDDGSTISVWSLEVEVSVAAVPINDYIDYSKHGNFIIESQDACSKCGSTIRGIKPQ